MIFSDDTKKIINKSMNRLMTLVARWRNDHQMLPVWRRKEELHIGRWRVEEKQSVIDKKIDLSNEDHCGTCSKFDRRDIKASKSASEDHAAKQRR
jgi:hypothetical protein